MLHEQEARLASNGAEMETQIAEGDAPHSVGGLLDAGPGPLAAQRGET
jgi:hypothetical protein